MKKIVLALIAACMTLSLCGCTKISDIVNIARAVSEGGNGGGEDIYGNNDPIYDGPDDGFTMEDFEDFMLYGDGTFNIPYGWEVSSRNSTSDKVFFIKEGDEEVDVPDNISVNYGTNHYSKSEHVAFREAILAQLLQQVGEGYNINGQGTTSDKGLTVYAFTITGDDSDKISQQIYIVGDYEYCLVYLTCFDNHQSCKDAAKELVDSFEWK